jgi:hypothetical protein
MKKLNSIAKHLNWNTARIVAGVALMVFGVVGSIIVYTSASITAKDMMYMSEYGIQMMFFESNPVLAIASSVSMFAGFMLAAFLPVFLKVQRGRREVRAAMNRSPYGYRNLLNDRNDAHLKSMMR